MQDDQERATLQECLDKLEEIAQEAISQLPRGLSDDENKPNFLKRRSSYIYSIQGDISCVRHDVKTVYNQMDKALTKDLEPLEEYSGDRSYDFFIASIERHIDRALRPRAKFTMPKLKAGVA